jgi:NAD-dependent SIR2 family protein deacetylase
MSPIINVKGFKCNKCGWVWISRQYIEDDYSTIPIACAKCKSSYWNRDPTTTTTSKKKKMKKKIKIKNKKKKDDNTR